MILRCNYEELRALANGADLVLADEEAGSSGGVAAPAEALALVEQLTPRLVGDLSVETLADQRNLRRAVAFICDNLRSRMEEVVVEHYPAHEEAVSQYFDYGYALAVLRRLDRAGEEMTAIIELTTGEPVSDASAATFNFPD